MKIAIFSDTFPPQVNGVANIAYQSAKILSELGHKVIVFAVAKKSPKNSNVLESENLKIVRLPSLPALVYPGERLAIPFFVSLPHIIKFKPNIIHIHTPFLVGWEGILAAKILKIPLVGTHHTFYDHYLKHAKLDYRWMKKVSWKYTVACYNFCDLVLSPAQCLIDTLSEKGLKRQTEIMRNWVDTDLFQPVSSKQEKNNIKKSFGIKDKSVLFFGRLSYEKSIDYIIKAFALMLKKMPDLKLMIVGDGPERKKLEKLTDNLKIKDNVIFTGFLYKKELATALQANDIFLTACKNETRPLSILEAMATGLPLVMVREKGLVDLLFDRVNGFFSSTDDPQDMAEKTMVLLSNSKLLKKFGEKSRLLAVEHSQKKVIKTLVEFYEKLKTTK